MTINEYYTQELRALRDLGAEFSEKNPGLSTFLSRKVQDPDVERLLEGFAFLTGRLRQYLDQELPEISHTLAQVLWPNFLRPIPSYSILQYNPIDTQDSIVIPKGEEVLAEHPKNNTKCIFTTCYETEVMPINLDSATYHEHGENGVIELSFSLNTNNINLKDISFDKLRFYIGDHEQLSEILYLYLTYYVEQVEIILENRPHEGKITNGYFKKVGFSEDEQILPLSKNTFLGHALLQEFFAYREKFFFLDLENISLNSLFSEKELEKSRFFSIKITLTEKLKSKKTIDKDNFKLYCTPIVNIFETEAIPISKNLEEEYEVIPASAPYQESEVYALQTVHGWDSRDSNYCKYLPFEFFEHGAKNTEYYQTMVKLSEDQERTKTFIRFGISSDTEAIYEGTKTVSIDILATNRNLPSLLEVGSISTPGSTTIISSVQFQNITIPTKSYIPPISGDFLWRIISNMTQNYLALDNIEILRNILEAYDFIGVSNLLQKKHTTSILKGLKSISHVTYDRIYKGLPIRGTKTKLMLNSKNFSSLGEAYLFATILDDFFALYCSINTFHEFEVVIDQKAKFSWEPRIGGVSLG